MEGRSGFFFLVVDFVEIRDWWIHWCVLQMNETQREMKNYSISTLRSKRSKLYWIFPRKRDRFRLGFDQQEPSRSRKFWNWVTLQANSADGLIKREALPLGLVLERDGEEIAAGRSREAARESRWRRRRGRTHLWFWRNNRSFFLSPQLCFGRLFLIFLIYF